ncbi:MAG: 50S ribosomal protein L5, partial [Nanopusillaceae archaeon]
WIPGLKYDPELGMIGMDVCVTVKRPGYRVMIRKIKRSSIPKRYKTTKEEVIKFLEENFKVKILREA